MKKVIFLLAIIAVLTFALAAYAEDYVKNPEWWTKAGEPYKGVTIKGITESTPPARAIKQIAAPLFEKLTGIKVEFELTSWDEMYNKSIQDIQSNAGIYDMIYTEGDISYAYITQKWITDLTPFVNNPKITEPNLDLPDFLPSFIKIFKDLSGNLFGLPSEAFLKSYVYRKDLFDDPEIQKAFQAKYNKDLKVPATWDEYTDIAKFFTAYGKEKGIELYGHIAQAKTHPCVAYEMCETIWPSWGVYNWGLNLEKMRATVANGGTLNGDTAKKAFAWYIDMLQYAPPGVKTYTWDEVAATFGAGKVAQGVIYLENLGWWEDPAQSQVAGKLGVAISPTQPGVLDEAKAGKGYIGYYDGAAFTIPVSSKNKEAAWLFIQFLARKEWQGEFAKLATRVVRTSTFDDPIVKELDPKFGGYFTLMKSEGNLYSPSPNLAMHRPLNELYLKWVSKAVAGEVKADEALDNLAKEIDAMMEELGY